MGIATLMLPVACNVFHFGLKIDSNQASLITTIHEPVVKTAATNQQVLTRQITSLETVKEQQEPDINEYASFEPDFIWLRSQMTITLLDTRGQN
jgi:hypothetical protein